MKIMFFWTAIEQKSQLRRSNRFSNFAEMTNSIAEAPKNIIIDRSKVGITTRSGPMVIANCKYRS
jgi:hypothetical protein